MGRHHLAWALAVTLALHGGVIWLANEAPEPEKRIEKEKKKKPISVRTVTRKAPEPKKPPVVVPKPVVEVVEVVEPPPTPPVALKPIVPIVPTTPPPKTEPAAASPDTGSKKPAKKKTAKKKVRRKKKRGPGRTVTSKNGRASPTSAESGSGKVLDLGDWDAKAGPGSSSPSPSNTDRTERADPPTGGGDAAPSSGGEAPKPPATAGKLIPPDPKSRPSGKYPAGAPRAAGPVDVVLSLRVSRSGRVSSASVVRSGGSLLDREAKRLARTIRFSPATRGGTPIDMTIPWTVTFK